MGWYLYDNPNPNAPMRGNGIRFWGYHTRDSNIRGIVMHTPETLEDYNPPDDAAENVARYFSVVARAASAHVCIDSDSIVECLPDDATAFHAAGVNSSTLGIEAGYKAVSWDDMPDHILYRVLNNIAEWTLPRVIKYRIPMVVIKSQDVWEGGARGFLEHRLTENWYGTPGRRSDPGNFPWATFFEIMEAMMEGHSPTEYNNLIGTHTFDADSVPDWMESAWNEYVAAGGSSNADSVRWMAVRGDLAWLYKTFIKPLEQRVKALESMTGPDLTGYVKKSEFNKLADDLEKLKGLYGAHRHPENTTSPPRVSDLP